jgi:hypothetical protein
MASIYTFSPEVATAPALLALGAQTISLAWQAGDARRRQGSTGESRPV